MKLLTAAILVLAATTAEAQSAPKRLYIEERVVNARNVSLEATKAFASSCPVVTVTDNRDTADYILRIHPGTTTLYAKNGDVAYVSSAKVKLSNMVKDVCKFVGSTHEN